MTVLSSNFNLEGVLVENDIDLSSHSSLRLLSRGQLITIKSKDSLIKLIKLLQEKKIDYQIIGNGSNLLLKEVVPIPLIKLDFPFDRKALETLSDHYVLPASINLSLLLKTAMALGLSGWEVFAGIPASLGGAVVMNAGTALGEICQIVEEVKYLSADGKNHVLKTSKEDFKYRGNNFLKKGDILYEVTLRHLGVRADLKQIIINYLQKRTAEQPLDKKTCGSVFKNIKNEGVTCVAGHYIDIMGLKGFNLNGICVSTKHANFFENEENGSYSDMIALIENVRSELYLQFGKHFELEVKI